MSLRLPVTRVNRIATHFKLQQPPSSTILTTRRFASAARMAPIPKTMKAVEIDKNGGTEVLSYRDVPVPEPQDGQVLVQNEFIGVNYIDTWVQETFCCKIEEKVTVLTAVCLFADTSVQVYTQRRSFPIA